MRAARLRSSRHRQQGSILLEALVAIVIFSFGLLGLIGLQANAISLSADARYRTDAALLANQLIGRLAIADPASAADFAHRPDGATPCAPGGSDSDAPAVTDWLAEVEATLPQAGSSKQQVSIDTASNVVAVTLCWQAPSGAPHHHTVTTQMQWQ